MQSSLLEAIESFDDWNRPWTFYPTVTQSVSVADSERFEAIWSAATSADLWVTRDDFCKTADKAEIYIAEKFTELSSKAVKQVVNGAAYKWR